MAMSFSALNLPSTRFPSNRSKWPQNAHRRSLFGQDVLWQDYDHHHPKQQQGGGRHLSPQTLEAYRMIGDPPVDEILNLLEEEGRPLKAGDDLLTLAQQCCCTQDDDQQKDQTSPPSNRALAAFYQRHQTLPSWVNLAEIQAGRTVFLTYTAAISISLYYRSLVPGFSIPKIAAVLTSTGYLVPPASSRDKVRSRLMDTGALIAACCCACSSNSAEEEQHDDDVQSLLPGGAGWKAALQVRVLHAKVRRALLKRTKGARAWNVEELGVPINQEDMAATLLAFSTNALLGCEMILGFPLPRRERNAYLAFWRYIGWLLGVFTSEEESETDDQDESLQKGVPRPLDPCGPGWLSTRPDAVEHSYAVLQSIIFHIMHPNEMSVKIAHHLLTMGRRHQDCDDKESSKQQLTHDNWFYFRALQCRRFVGHPLADALELPYHPVWYQRIWLWVASSLYLWILRFYTLAALPYSPFRRHIVRFHQRQMQTFLDRWNETHPVRMHSAETTRKNESPCPFAMVSLPQY